MSLRREIVMRIILDIVDNVRRVKKKGLERGLVLRDAEMMGLNIDEARDAIEDLRDRGILQCEEEDGMLVDEKERLQLAKCLMDFLKDETSYTDKKHVDLDQTIESDAVPLQQDKPCCPHSDIKSQIISSFSQLTGSIAELHEEIWKERHNNQTLQAQIFDLKMREMAQIEQSTENINRHKPKQISTQPISAFKGKSENAINQPIVIQEDIYSEITEAIKELRRKASNNKSNSGNKSKKSRQKRSRNKEPSNSEIAGDQPRRNKAKRNQRQDLSRDKPVETSKNIAGNIKSRNNSNKPSSNKNQTSDQPIPQSDSTNYSKSNNNSNTNPQQRKMNKEGKIKSRIILAGDSMIKNIKGWSLKKRMNQNEDVFVHSFPGATVTDMHSYCKPLIDKKPNTIVLHCGTNNLRSNKSDIEISTKIITLAKSIASNNIRVIVSGLIMRGDNLEDR